MEKTRTPPRPATTLTSPAPAPSPGARERSPGRPTVMTAQMLDMLCAMIRETGASDSAAAARAGLHPSTVSRWKAEVPDVAILLRAAREEFRQGQLEIIFCEASAGRATGWRAAAWVLERIFPEDYAPRASERAKFQELYEAKCAREGEGSALEEEEIGPSDNRTLGGAHDRGGALQNVQNADPLPSSRSGGSAGSAREPGPSLKVALDRAGSPAGGRGADSEAPRFAGRPLQNVKNTALAGPVCPPTLATAGDSREVRWA